MARRPQAAPIELQSVTARPEHWMRLRCRAGVFARHSGTSYLSACGRLGRYRDHPTALPLALALASDRNGVLGAPTLQGMTIICVAWHFFFFLLCGTVFAFPLRYASSLFGGDPDSQSRLISFFSWRQTSFAPPVPAINTDNFIMRRILRSQPCLSWNAHGTLPGQPCGYSLRGRTRRLGRGGQPTLQLAQARRQRPRTTAGSVHSAPSARVCNVQRRVSGQGSGTVGNAGWVSGLTLKWRLPDNTGLRQHSTVHTGRSTIKSTILESAQQTIRRKRLPSCQVKGGRPCISFAWGRVTTRCKIPCEEM